MTEFNYPHTCPDIDKARDSAKYNIVRFLESRLEYFIHPKLYDELVDTITDEIFEMADQYRDISGRMRDAASEQLTELTEEICDLQEVISNNE